jgi:hypothetical protein
VSENVNNSKIFDWDSQRNESGEYLFQFPQKIRECLIGEIFKVSENICYRCPQGLYSLNPGIENCFDCPSNMVCQGGDNLTVEPNFWRYSYEFTVAMSCSILPKACKGGNLSNQCNFGYTGILCAVCIFDERDQFFRNTFAECVSCKDKNIIIPILILIGFAFLVIIQLLFTLRESVQVTKKRVTITVSLLSNMLVNYVEMGGVVKNILENIPDSLKAVVNFSSMLLDLDNSTGIINCFLGDVFEVSSESLYEMRQIFVTSTLGFIFCLPFLFWALMKLRYGKRYQSQTIVLITLITMFKIMMQPILKFFFKNFDCFSAGNKKYLVISSNIECFSASHLSTIFKVVLPGILVFLVIPSLLMLRYIVVNRNKLSSPEISIKVWLIILGYQHNYYYWEFFLLLKKILLISVPIALGDNVYLSSLVLIIIMFLSMLIQIKFKPYNSEKLNNLALFQYFALYSIYAASLFLVSIENMNYRIGSLGLAASINGCFIVYWSRFFFQVYKSEIKQTGFLWRGIQSLSKLLVGIGDLRQTILIRRLTSPRKSRMSVSSEPRRSKFQS